MPELPETLKFFFSVAGGRGDPYNIWLGLILASLLVAVLRFYRPLRTFAFVLVQLIFAAYMLNAAFWGPNLEQLQLGFSVSILPVLAWLILLWNAATALYTVYVAATPATPIRPTRALVFGGHIALFGMLAASAIMPTQPFALPGILPMVVYSWCVSGVLIEVCKKAPQDEVREI